MTINLSDWLADYFNQSKFSSINGTLDINIAQLLYFAVLFI